MDSSDLDPDKDVLLHNVPLSEYIILQKLQRFKACKGFLETISDDKLFDVAVCYDLCNIDNF